MPESRKKYYTLYERAVCTDCKLQPQLDQRRRCHRARRRRTTAVRSFSTSDASRKHTLMLCHVYALESKPYYAALLRRHTHCKRRTEKMKWRPFTPPQLRERSAQAHNTLSVMLKDAGQMSPAFISTHLVSKCTDYSCKMSHKPYRFNQLRASVPCLDTCRGYSSIYSLKRCISDLKF